MMTSTRVDGETFRQLTTGRKSIEIGHPDHSLQAGETLQIDEWDGDEPTGRRIEAVVTAVIEPKAGEPPSRRRIRFSPKVSKYSHPEGRTGKSA